MTVCGRQGVRVLPVSLGSLGRSVNVHVIRAQGECSASGFTSSVNLPYVCQKQGVHEMRTVSSVMRVCDHVWSLGEAVLCVRSKHTQNRDLAFENTFHCPCPAPPELMKSSLTFSDMKRITL